MTTIILAKRTMAPRNILLNLVEGDVSLLTKAKDYFSAACRSVVGYKQIAELLGVTVIVIPSVPVVSLVVDPVIIPTPQLEANVYNPNQVLFNELARTNTLALHNLDRIVKNVYKDSKEFTTEEERSVFRDTCIKVREELKDILMVLPNGWYFIETAKILHILQELLIDQVEEPVIEEEVVVVNPTDNIEDEWYMTDDTPWYV